MHPSPARCGPMAGEPVGSMSGGGPDGRPAPAWPVLRLQAEIHPLTREKPLSYDGQPLSYDRLLQSPCPTTGSAHGPKSYDRPTTM
jgi:hypothetical protein